MNVFPERLWQDLSHGCRMLAKNPTFTLVAVISLAIGIGYATSVASAERPGRRENLQHLHCIPSKLPALPAL
jgi:hypothetical protein